MIIRTFFVTVATRWIPTLYSILCPYEAAKILCPALCVSWSRASAWLQVMAMFQKGHSLGQDWYTASVRDSLQSPSLPKNFTPPLPSCLHTSNLALLCCAGLQHSWDLAPATWGSSMGQWSNSVCWSGCWRDSCFPISFPSPVLLPPWLHKLFFFITYG